MKVHHYEAANALHPWADDSDLGDSPEPGIGITLDFDAGGQVAGLEAPRVGQRAPTAELKRARCEVA